VRKFGALDKRRSIWREQLACVENLDSDLVCARGLHLDILEFEWLARTPAYGGLAFDDLSYSFRHDSAIASSGLQ
jgi:hypothetical protein